MQVNSDRRTQIIEAMIEVIAADGLAAASFARIREHAGLSSTRLISYHFESRDELVTAVMQHILARAGEEMSPQIAAATTWRDKLAAYIRSNLAFLGAQPSAAVAAVQIVAASAVPTDSGQQRSEDLLAQLFEAGRAAGELRPLDPGIAAATVRAAIDRAVGAFAIDRSVDLDHYADELVELFDRAVRAG